MLHRLPAQMARRDFLIADHGRDLHARRPAATRRHDHLVVHVGSGDARVAGEVDVRRPGERAAFVGEGDAAVAAVVHCELALLVDATFFDLEQVCEIRADQQLDRAERGFLAVILDLEVFAHPPPDVPAPNHHQVRVGPAAGRMAPQHEHGAERVRGRRGERLGRRAVEREPQLRDETRVAKEQALRMVGVDFPRTARDAENPLRCCSERVLLRRADRI